MHMNWDRIEGDWKQIKSRVKQQWNKLTDDHLDGIAGKRAHLVGKIGESYRIGETEAERQVKDWEESNQDIFAETAAEARKHKGDLKGA
jgi:uncharacterized protein YjbJ (UPF0337 family)